MKEKAIGKIIGGLLICLLLGLVFGGIGLAVPSLDSNSLPQSQTMFNPGDIVSVVNTGDSGLIIHKDSPTGETLKVVADGWTFKITLKFHLVSF